VTPLAFAAPPAGDDESGPPQILELDGIVRDFRERTATNGHPDFERRPEHGFGHYSGNIAPMLGDDNKPVFTGGGFKLRSQFRDSMGRAISYVMYDADAGDSAGEMGATDDGGIDSAASFAQWFRDVPGVNISLPLTLTFHRQSDGTYVFDDKLDDAYADLGGFFPIEDQLLGNPGGSPDRNFHFTFELHTEFTYHEGAEQVFRFLGDDDVWVFINNQLVIDLGGVHSATDQIVDLDRLDLEDGEIYPLDFFFAERHRTQSNFRCETNLALTPVELPAVTAAFD
jgi:fibro-slime domain-containing protein